jgi:hypothetical protein
MKADVQGKARGARDDVRECGARSALHRRDACLGQLARADASSRLADRPHEVLPVAFFVQKDGLYSMWKPQELSRRSGSYSSETSGLPDTRHSIQEMEMKPLKSLLAVPAVLAALLVTAAPPAQAEVVLTPRGCQTYASWSGNLVWARDLGADKAKAKAELVQMDKKEPSSIYALMLRDFEALWTTAASWEAVTMLILKDCVSRGGRYGAAS